jgi:hypothetical protein
MDTERQYAVLYDRSLEELRAFSAEHPRCFVVPLYTRSALVPAWSGWGSGAHHVMPMCVSNLSQTEVQQVLAGWRDFHCIRDETPR